MATQQEVIKKFMASLDRTSKSGVAALDEAIQACSNFDGVQAVINKMKRDIATAGDSTKFLKDYCGINLDNDDTGAITGYDAGGSTYEKDASAIVPESGSLKNFTDNSFYLPKYGITFCLSEIDNNGYVNMNSTLSFYDLTPKQQYIWQGLYTWWANNALDLITESYGSNFGFSSSHLITPKIIYFGFYEGNDYTGLATEPFQLNGDTKTTARLVIKANMNIKQYGNVNTSDPNGANINSDVYYIDRAIAHELTHAVMAANINYYYDLPQFITEGMAELTHGADDSQERQLYMKALASKNSSLFDKTFNVNESGTGDSNAYAGGYMFMRYLAKQAAESLPSTVGVNKDNTISNTSIYGTAYNDTLTNSGNYVTISSANGKDKISNSGTNVLVYSGDDNDTINNNNSNAKNVSIFGGDGDDYISSYGERSSLVGGNGADTFYSGGKYSTVLGGAGNDSIYISSFGSYSTVYAYAGNDSINNFGTSILFKYVSGDGNDIITGFNATSTLQIGNGSGTYSTTKSGSGSDIIVSVGSGVITLSGAASLSSIHIDGVYQNNSSKTGTEGADSINNTVSGKTINALGGNDTVYNGTNGTNVLINGANGNDSIKNLAGKVTISGGANDDTILSYGGYSSKIDGGTGRDYIVNGLNTNNNLFGTGTTLLGGDGDDTIKNFSEKVTISGGKGNDSIANWSDNVTIDGGEGNDTVYNDTNGTNVLINGANGNDSIKNLASKVTISGGANDDTILSYGGYSSKIDGGTGRDYIVNGLNTNNNLFGTGTTLLGGDGDDTIKNVSEKVTISGGKGNDSICSGAQEVSINAGSGNDYIYLYENATKTTVKGGKGNDTIFGNAGNDKLYGETGNDLLKGGAGNDSLWGGKGNDTLWGDAGADKFLYASGDGKDIIFGFDNNDMLKITGKFSASYSKSKREIYFKVGSTASAITLKDFTATTFNINGKNYKISSSKLK